MWNEDDRKWLYEKMKGAGINTGSYADFSASMDNDADRDWYFKKAQSMGLNIGSASDFAAMMSTPKQQTPVVEQPQQVQTPAAAAPAPLTSAQARPQSGAYNPSNGPLLQQMKKDGKIKPTIPSFSDVAEQMAFKPMQLFESEQTVDANGNIVSKPKPVPTFKNGRMGMGYHDMFTGEYYDINDPASESIVKNNTRTYESMKDLAAINRQQVGNMTKSIDDMLTKLRGEATGERVERIQKAADKGFVASLMEAMSSTAGAANPTDMQAMILMKSKYGNEDTPETIERGKQIRQLEAAQRSMRDAQRIINEADHNAQEGTLGKWLESSFVGGAARGFGQRLFDADTWDMGVSDLSDNLGLMNALKKADKGDKLTEAEQMLLDAKAVELATNAYFGSYVGRGYGAGQVTAEAIPFMIEMCVNPASATGQGAQSMLTRYALKRFGKQAIKDNAKKYIAANATSRVVGDLAGSAVMAATTGSVQVAANTAERMNGDVIAGTDDVTGETVFGGHTEGEDFGTAFAKAYGSKVIENYSEMFGEYFAPVLAPAAKWAGGQLSKGMGKIGLGRVNDFMENVAASDVARLVSDFEKHSKWNGVFGEYAEEVAGNMMNALVVGDMTMDTAEGTGVFNLDQNIDTFLGVSLMGGFISGVKTLGYRTPKYRARKDMMKADDNAATLFTDPSDWGAIRNTIAFGSDEDASSVIADVLSNENLTEEQKKAVLKYANKAETYKGILRAEDSRRSEDVGTVDVDAETSYDNGYTLDTDEDMNDAKNMYDYKRQQMQELVTEDFLEQFDNDPVGSVAGLLNNDAFTEDEKQLALDYVNAKATYDGMLDRVRDDIDSHVEASNRAVDSHVNTQSGMIHPATLKLNDRKVYVVDGNLVMHEDGGIVDIANSSESILVRDAETGKLEWASPHDVLSVDEQIEPAEEKEAAQAAIREKYAQQKADVIDGVLPFAVGDTYNILDEQGQQHQAQILQDNGDGTVQVSYDGTEAITAPKAAIQDMAENANLARLQQFEQQRTIERQQKAAQEAQEQYEAQRPVYNLNDEITIRDDAGNLVRGSVTAEENEDGQIEVYTEFPVNGQKINLFTRDQLDAMVEEQNGVLVEPSTVQNDVENVSETTENVQNAAENVPASEETVAVEPMPMVKVRGKMKPDWGKATPARAHAYLYNERGLSRENANAFVENNRKASASELEKLRKKKPEMGTDLDEFEEKTAEWQSKMDEAQRLLDYWNGVREIQNAIQRKENERRAAEEAARHEKAVAQAQSDFEARKKAEEERKAVGNENPMPAITEKWNGAVKIDGHNDEVVLPNGETIKGHYVLHESGASSPSHDPETWQKTDGFPMDSNDNSVNDRDYERDNDAQQHTQSIARNYDQRALQNVPVVSKDGVVLSGNGRTMAGQLAARDNTDAAYVNYLKEYAHKFGFTPEQVEGMQHPRVSFVPDEAMPYTAETFAKFNQQDMKSQNKTEQAVKLGKTVDDDVFKRIVKTINGYETLGDFYNDANASLGAVYDLHRAGVIPQAQLAEMVDGVRGQEKLSAVGREFLENMLIGKAFAANPDVVRMLTSEPFMRKAIITALGEIADNIAIGGGWSLQQELADAVKLCFDARKEGAKQGDIVSIYAKQGVLFADPDQLQTVADFNNATMLMLADALNDKRVTILKITIQLYNNDARESAAGKTDMFAGGIRSREAILRDVINFIRKNYGKGKEIEAARAAAVERRKAESIQQNGAPQAGSGGSENTGGSGRSETSVERQGDLAQAAVTAPLSEEVNEFDKPFVISSNGTTIFGEVGADSGLTAAPIKLSVGENVKDDNGANHGYGLLHIEAGHGDQIRAAGFASVEEFVETVARNYDTIREGSIIADNQTYLLEVSDEHNNTLFIQLSRDGSYWNVNSAGIFKKKYSRRKQEVFTRPALEPDTNTDTSGVDSGQENGVTTPAGNSPQTSESKGKGNSSTSQAKGEKVAENQSSSGVQAALEAAEQDTNTEPTEAQKQAGNYKKGHVKIDGFDVTIENPKGSVRRGTDANGKQWEQTMHNTYGYIRGTEGVDGDHIDVFFSEDPSQGDVFVVDQVNKDGSFDEHKVMYGFPDIESARKAYLANYEDGWTGLGAITPVSKEEFKKWVQSSRRKTKPFAEYSSVKPLGDTQLGEQPNKPTVKDGEDYVSAAERIAREDDVKRTAAHFAMETREEAAAFDRRVGEMSDLELLSYIKADGNGDVNKAHHPSVYDEYDYRHGDEQLQSYDATLVRLNESGTTLEQAEEMLANIRRDKSLLATDMRADLLGQEDALQDYIAGLEKPREKWLFSAYEKKETSEPANSRMDVESNLEGKSDDTATRQDSDVSGGKVRNNPAISQRNGVRKGGVDELVSDAMSIGVEDVASFPKEIREEDTISKEQNSSKRGDRIKVKAGMSGNDLYIQYKSGRSSKDKRRWATIKIPNATNYSAGQIIYRLGYIGTFTDIERLSGDAVLELFNKNGLRLHKGGWKEVSPREDALRDALVNVLRGAGVDVVTDVEEGQRVLDYANGETRLQAKKRALETASVTSKEKHQPTVVSSADGAKVLKNLDKLVEDFEKLSNQSKFFTGAVAQAIGAQRKGSKSEYATFETKNGRVVTIRLADHNATVSNFDRRGELDGISIVVSPKKSAGVTNDGEAHVVEYYYDAIKLRRADGKPLADIVRSIKQALYSGEFEDTTGLAERQEVNTDKVRFFRTPDGHAYGFTKDGKIYIDPRIATAETPIHEYSHLWAWAFRKANPKEWANIVELMKGTTLWEEVKQRYPELKTEDEIADEVLAHYSGRRGAERLRAERERIAIGEGDVVEKAKAISALERVKDALKRFWKGVADWLGIHFTNAEEVADKVLADMLNGVNPAANAGAQREGVRYEANSEEAEIVAKAKADGTYMKAPNGKASKLSPRQWVQVRTRAFKEWFGDWELASKVLKVVPALKEHGFKNFDEARAWAKEHIVRTLTDAETGGKGEIRVSNNAVAKFLSESAVAKSDSKDLHLSVLKILPDVIRESIDAEQHPDYKKGEDGSRSAENGVNEHVTIHRLYGAINVDGKTYRVKVTLKEDRTNNEPQKAYSYEATKIELLAGQHEEAVTSSRNSNNSITAANLLKDVEKSYGNGEKLLDYSKVVDENGEPLVVYHQTNSTIFVNRETGENFDNLSWKEKDYWKNEASEEEWNDTWEERDFYVFDNKTHGRRSVEMPAFFFSPVYDEYHEYGDRTVAAFLNIRNPIVNPDIPNRGVTDTAGEDAMNALIAQGYDGFIREYDGEVEEINAFFPNQIKSAEENVGTFDGSNPDIRYLFVGEKGAASMDKAEEASVRLDNLAVAREMEAAGKDAKAVKLATGWERGGDGKWRYEIEDGRFDSLGELHPERRRLSAAEQKELDDASSETDDVLEKGVLAYKEEITKDTDMADIYEAGGMERKKAERIRDLEDKQRRLKGEPKKLDDYLENDELFNAYPQLRDIVIDTSSEGDAVFGKMGSYVHASNTIRLNDTSLSTLTHEVQHAIQKIEGFARGGSVRDVRNRIRQRIAELDNVSEHAKEMLARQVEYRALASKLGRAYEMLMKNGEDWAVRAASDNYWEAMNTLYNDENSRLNNVYPKGKNASEIAKDGFNRDKAIEELNRLSDYYASQISAEDMKNIKDSEALSGKINGKSDEELYHALGGEVEARNVQSRLGMTAEERRASLASETEDVAREDQIFLEDGLGVSMSESASETDLEDVNRRFNDELGRLTEENKDKVVLSLGRPSAVLLSAGVEDKPMKLYGNKVMKKMKKHGFSLDELKNLPRAVADPIAVFDNYQLDGNRTVLTELQSKGKNIMKLLANDKPKTAAEKALDAIRQRVMELFEQAGIGEFTGKPKSIGRLSGEGKALLEKLSSQRFKEFVDFMLNPSDLNHIHGDHYGENEKNPGNNIPLTDADIMNLVDVINQPDGILYGIDKKDGRKLFFFLKDAGNGLYNLTEVCSTKKGNITAKSFFKTKKKGINQRVMEITDSLLPRP